MFLTLKLEILPHFVENNGEKHYQNLATNVELTGIERYLHWPCYFPPKMQ